MVSKKAIYLMFIRLYTPLPKIALIIVLIRLDKRIVTIEKENEIKVRWNSDDPDYVRALPKYFEHKRKEVLVAARDKVYEKVFLQTQKSKYAGL